ncbi:MAG: hypothetical protein WBN75_06830 [Verrucomicrobiia bacterium]
MKQMSAILFGLLLVWAQLSAAPTPPVCAKQPAHACCHCGGKMSCCSSSSSGSQPMTAVPSNAGPQKQLSISVPAIVAMARPETRLGLSSPFSRLFLLPYGAPLYARDCARLI